jgi:hypothetical protein
MLGELWDSFVEGRGSRGGDPMQYRDRVAYYEARYECYSVEMDSAKEMYHRAVEVYDDDGAESEWQRVRRCVTMMRRCEMFMELLAAVMKRRSENRWASGGRS